MKIFYNGKIITMKSESDFVTAVCIEDGIIKKVGTDEEILTLKNDDTQLIDLDGKTMLPGFIDGHSHFAFQALISNFVTLYQPPIGEVKNFDDIVNKLTEALETHDKNYPLIAWGYDHNVLEEKEHPKKEILDKASKDIPIICIHTSGHVGTLNSAALKEYNITETTGDVPGGVVQRDPQTKEPTGYVEETVLHATILPLTKFFPKFTKEVYKSITEQGQLFYTSQGITTAQDGLSDDAGYEMFKAMEENGNIDIDIHAYPGIIVENNWKTGKLGIKYGDKIGPATFSGYKIHLDGSPQARTAWMTKPYKVVEEGDDPDYVAYPFYDDDQIVIDAMVESLKLNAQFLTHCNGDAAADQFIRCYKKALEIQPPTKEIRPIVIHSQTLREDQIDELLKLECIASFFVSHTYFWGDVHIKNFGMERAKQISNIKYANKVGLPYTDHQDSPVLPPNPILGIWAGVNRITREGVVLGPDYRVSVYEMLKAYTKNGAYCYFEEDIKGTIEEGKLADFVILDQDIMTIDSMKIKDISILETIKRGKTLYKK